MEVVTLMTSRCGERVEMGDINEDSDIGRHQEEGKGERNE